MEDGYEVVDEVVADHNRYQMVENASYAAAQSVQMMPQNSTSEKQPSVAKVPCQVKVLPLVALVAVCVVAMLAVSSIAIALVSYVRSEDTIKDMKARINELKSSINLLELNANYSEDTINDMKAQINALTLELNATLSELADIVVMGPNGTTVGIHGKKMG